MKIAGDSLIARLASLKIGYLFLLVFSVCSSLQAQTYEISPSAAPNTPAAPKKQAPNKQTSGKQPKPSQGAPSPGASLGWGSNIQDARIARAAELALKQGNHGLAVSLA